LSKTHGVEKVKEVEVRELDLASLDSVRGFARAFNKTHRRLDVLICNAGIMAPPERQQTADGMEQQFQVQESQRNVWHKNCVCAVYE